MKRKSIKVTEVKNDPIVRENLQKLAELAVKQGAENAVVIPTSDIIIDPRVRFKCMIPKCYMSGACNHCPPHGYGVEEVRKTVFNYRWAVFFRVRVESSVIAAKGLADRLNTGKMDEKKIVLSLGTSYFSIFSIVSNIRKNAEEMGYSPTRGFAAGNCRDVLCYGQSFCQMLSREKTCRNATISNPSLESCGIDAFTMAARAGWDVYPIGGTCEPDSVLRGSLMGLVLVT